MAIEFDAQRELGNVFGTTSYGGTMGSTGGAFNTGIDILDGIMGGYFQYEQQKIGLELQEAQLQQQRLQNAISTDQQTALFNMQRAESVTSENKISPMMMMAGAAALVGLIMVLK